MIRHWTELPSHQDMSPYADFYISAVEKARANNKDGIVEIAEIGVRHGCSARIFQSVMTHQKDRLYLIDPEYDQNLDDLLKGDGRIFFLSFTGEQACGFFDFDDFDLVHIDADPHGFEQTRSLFYLYIAKVRKGGVIVFHDCSPKFGVFKFVQSLENDPKYAVVYCKPSPICVESVPAYVVRLWE